MSAGRKGDTYVPFRSQVIAHPGVMLREAREAAGINQQTIAEELYLTLHYVQAIEQGEFSRLPGATFVRGYLRSYARRVGIPEARVMELFDEYQRDRAEAESRERRGATDVERWQRRVWVSMALLLVGLFLMGLYVVLAPPESEPVEVADHDPPASVASEAKGGKGAPAPGRLTALPEGQLAKWNRESGPAQGPAPAAEPVAEAAEAPSEAPAVDRFEQRSSVLEMHFYSDCWVQVKDASGSTLAFGVKKAGEALTLEGESPYTVRIGNVRGARLLFNGAEVDLQAYARNNTANFVLN